MAERSSHEVVTELAHAVEQGNRAALDELFPLIYRELAILARQQRRTWPGDLSLDSTALVHELYLKVADQSRLSSNSRAHFFAVAATAMRHILCNHARDRRRHKRGGEVPHLRLMP